MSFGMDKTKALKWSLAAVVTIFLGALGSGLWQSLLAPAVHAISRWILDIASLGLASYKNGVYLQVAADNQSNIGLAILALLTMGFCALTGFFFGTLSGRRIAMQRLDAAAQLKILRRASRGLYSGAVLIFLLLVAQFITLARLSYVNSADAHYHFVLRAIAPYLVAGEQVQVESDFTQIRSRDDYIRLLERLESQCKAHGLTVPKFDPW
jgi:hypothetical protein